MKFSFTSLGPASGDTKTETAMAAVTRPVETLVKINIEQAYLKTDAKNIEQSRAAMVLAEKHQYWKDRFQTAEQGGKPCAGGCWNSSSKNFWIC